MQQTLTGNKLAPSLLLALVLFVVTVALVASTRLRSISSTNSNALLSSVVQVRAAHLPQRSFALPLLQLGPDLVDQARGAHTPPALGPFLLPTNAIVDAATGKQVAHPFFPAIYNHTGTMTGEVVVRQQLLVSPLDHRKVDPQPRRNGQALPPPPPPFFSVLQTRNPRLLYIHNMLSPELCERMIAVANGSMGRSMVIDKQLGGKKSNVDSVRTSYGTFLVGAHAGEMDDANIVLRAHGASILGLAATDHLEATQVLRYDAGQYYKPHVDFFDPWDTVNLDRGGQRIATILTWLNDVEGGGGDTSFPRVGITLKPKRGDAVVFYSMDEHGEMNPYTEHGAVPPEDGAQKWVAVLWAHPRTFV